MLAYKNPVKSRYDIAAKKHVHCHSDPSDSLHAGPFQNTLGDNLYLLERGLMKLWSTVSLTKRAGLVVAYVITFPESYRSSYGDMITEHTPTASSRCLVFRKLSFQKKLIKWCILVTEKTAEIESECK